MIYLQTTDNNAIKGGKPTISNVQQIICSLNLVFASKKVFTDFLITSFLVVVIPVLFVWFANEYMKDRTDMSEVMKIVWVVGPALIWMNAIIAYYIYQAIKDPENYKVDPPIKITMKPKTT